MTAGEPIPHFLPVNSASSAGQSSGALVGAPVGPRSPVCRVASEGCNNSVAVRDAILAAPVRVGDHLLLPGSELFMQRQEEIKEA